MNLLLLILMLSVLGSKFREGDSQMLNGFELDQQDFNYYVFLFADGTYKCAGGIVDENHVITAAHCVENFEEDQLHITAGAKYLHDHRRVLRLVKKKFVPDDFHDRADGYHDIAVLRLWTPFDLGENIGVMTFPTAPISADDGTICSVAGLEKRNPVHGRPRASLSWLKLMLIPNDVCKCMLGHSVQSFLLCATSVDENEVTHGDSGTILVCDGVAVGILEGGRNHVYAFGRIYDFASFIRNKTASP